jgi:hypothetical protein
MDERHFCTDFELCPECGLCADCCTGECQTPEVRYVQSSDSAVSGDNIL